MERFYCIFTILSCLAEFASCRKLSCDLSWKIKLSFMMPTHQFTVFTIPLDFGPFQNFSLSILRWCVHWKKTWGQQRFAFIYSRNMEEERDFSLRMWRKRERYWLTESSQAEFSSARHSFFFCGTLIDVLFFVQQNLGKDLWCLLLLCVLGQLLRAPKDNKEWGAQSPEAVDLEQLRCATHPCRLGLSDIIRVQRKNHEVLWHHPPFRSIKRFFSMAPAPRMAWPKGTQVMYHSWGSKASLASPLQVHQGIYWPWLIQTNADNNHSVTNNW